MNFKLHIISMDITHWYAVTLGGTVALLIIASILLAILTITRKYATFRFLKHVYYPQVDKYLRGSEKTTRFDLTSLDHCLFGGKYALYGYLSQ